ncbi:hypothetical protein Q6348_12530 [Isoptericola sp. b441]|uniref:GDT1 family protein n=1 Tax=Actinotalea lenta TaxID=3064654 RepID=A0ABT9DCV7_9CELL|nr:MULTISPECIES: hypothetical protein [unclassified Isoptericola]MDO8108023.1 hypothetical protein [Isoptericola sp. b441]MDO8120307.1 hypothetical protein [Isoptericola sp. b490]
MNWVVTSSTFLAAAIEVIEMVAIVVAVGVSRSWKWSLFGAAGGVVVLAALVAILGTALQHVALDPLRLIVGALLLVFGLQWLRKGASQVARMGWSSGIGDQSVDDSPAGEGVDWTSVVLSFKGVSLEGLEVSVIVVAFGSAGGNLGSAIIGAAAALVVVGALGGATYKAVARIPRRALQLFVGALLSTFGTFWANEGLGVSWPGEDWSLLGVLAVYVLFALSLTKIVRGWQAHPEQSDDRELATEGAR